MAYILRMASRTLVLYIHRLLCYPQQLPSDSDTLDFRLCCKRYLRWPPQFNDLSVVLASHPFHHMASVGRSKQHEQESEYKVGVVAGLFHPPPSAWNGRRNGSIPLPQVVRLLQCSLPPPIRMTTIAVPSLSFCMACWATSAMSRVLPSRFARHWVYRVC